MPLRGPYRMVTELDPETKQKELHQSYLEELASNRLAWRSLQLPLVAGA